MKVYRIKKIIDGSVIGLQGKFVAVPDIDYDRNIHYDNGLPFAVRYEDKQKTIKSFKEAKTFRVFDDRLKRGKYRLGYFEWL
jgi:hypothetical protein